MIAETDNRVRDEYLPQWKIVLEHLIYQDHFKLYRICRKMIIYLDRLKVPAINDIVSEMESEINLADESRGLAANKPMQASVPYINERIVDRIFSIAQEHLPDETILLLLNQWARKENLSVLSSELEKRHSTLAEAVGALKKFIKQYKVMELLSQDEKIGLRVALINRFLSDSLTYINIAKKYIKIKSIADIADCVIGPANGSGRLGGKSAGMILAREILSSGKVGKATLEGVDTPKSWFVTSDALQEFINYNALDEFVFVKYQNTEEIQEEYPFLENAFRNSLFPPDMLLAFGKILDDMEGKPIIVRSSSLLEDSFEASFSGKYKSIFLANTGSKDQRLTALADAVAEVYASTFAPDPIVYRRERGLLDFREEMSVLIQEVVGTRIGKYYFPSFSGVAFSNNEYRWSKRLKREEGIIRLVVGLGTRAVDRTMDDFPTLISPGQPGIRVNQAPEDVINYSQKYVDVINLDRNCFETITFETLLQECKGFFPLIEKVVSFNREGVLVEPVSSYADFLKENPVITFNSFITNTGFVKKIREILETLKEALGEPVDIEFASDGDKLVLLQCRPQSKAKARVPIEVPSNVPKEDIIFTSDKFVNNGLVEGIRYIVYVDGEAYARLSSDVRMYETGKIIGKLNRLLEKRQFILIGPGRWGSKGDIRLGVPVIYSDINNSAMLIEIGKERNGYMPELSFGTHFFQDLVESDIKYLPLYPDSKCNYFNDAFFSGSENVLAKLIPEAEPYKDVITVVAVGGEDSPTTLSVYMDGFNCKSMGVVKR